MPLLVLIEAAKAGNEKEVEDYAQVFTEHANKLIEVIIIFELFCYLSDHTIVILESIRFHNFISTFICDMSLALSMYIY